jgi:hypothetical protein
MPGNGASGATREVVRQMAEREAAVHLQYPYRAAYLDSPPVTVGVVVEPCPWCGRDSVPEPPHARLAPLREVRVRTTGPEATDPVTLRALACESLTARSLLLLVKGAVRDGLPAGTFTTRAVAAKEAFRTGGRVWIDELVTYLDRAESWADEMLGIAPRPAGPASDEALWTLPAAARLSPPAPAGPLSPPAPRSGKGGPAADREAAARGLADVAAPHFVTPHLHRYGLTQLNADYLAWRRSAIESGLGRSLIN